MSPIVKNLFPKTSALFKVDSGSIYPKLDDIINGTNKYVVFMFNSFALINIKK